MRYCYNCDHVTVGDPLFCNFCGRSYDVKLCPKLHVNPRNAEACSRCGSRDLSTPQPKVPFWASFLFVLLYVTPALTLAIFSIFALKFLIQHFLRTPNVLLALAALELLLGILWWGWTEVPRVFRRAIHKMLKRRNQGGGD